MSDFIIAFSGALTGTMIYSAAVNNFDPMRIVVMTLVCTAINYFFFRTILGATRH